MSKLIIAVFFLILCFGLLAQWSTNASDPNQICNLTSAQVLPKTAVTSGGITWIAWMDNTSGNYNTYLQKLNLLGVPEWTSPLLVSSNPTMTWLTEWDMDSDNEGNAVMVFQDIRLGTNNVVIYKISTDGTFLWGANGIMLSSDTNLDYGNMSPTVLCLQSGRTVVAWQRLGTNTSIILQSISATGTLEWGANGITLSMAGVSYTWPQLLESDTCCILVKYYEDIGPIWAPTRKILVQKYDTNGQALWINPTVVQNQGGITAWTQWLSIASDGTGGLIICWHDDRNAENISYSYIQHILVNGAVTMDTDGARVSTEAGYHQFYPKLAFEPDQQEVYVFWNRENSNQNMWGLQMQKLGMNGERLWGDSGIAFEPLGTYPTFPINAMNMASGVIFLYDISPVSGNDQVANIKAFGVNNEGMAIWGGGSEYIASTSTAKLHYDSNCYQDLWGIATWEDDTGNSNIYAMRFNYNGTLGTIAPTPYNLTAEVVNDNIVMLDWEFPELLIPPIGYNVYRNDVFCHLVTGGNTTHDSIPDMGPGEWTFHVTAVYENLEESLPSNPVTINITANQDEEIATTPLSLTIYPNPFQKGVNLSVKGINYDGRTHMTIYNIKGQIVYKMSFIVKQELNWNWDGKDLNNSDVSPGLYLVKVSSGNTQCTNKLMKY